MLDVTMLDVTMLDVTMLDVTMLELGVDRFRHSHRGDLCPGGLSGCERDR